MEIMALTYRLKHGEKDVYLEKHKNMWPEMYDALNRAGVHKIEIFLRGNRLFLVAEVESKERFNKVSATDKVYVRWNKQWDDVLEAPFDENEEGPFAEMENVFSFGGESGLTKYK